MLVASVIFDTSKTQPRNPVRHHNYFRFYQVPCECVWVSRQIVPKAKQSRLLSISSLACFSSRVSSAATLGIPASEHDGFFDGERTIEMSAFRVDTLHVLTLLPSLELLVKLDCDDLLLSHMFVGYSIELQRRLQPQRFIMLRNRCDTHFNSYSRCVVSGLWRVQFSRFSGVGLRLRLGRFEEWQWENRFRGVV
jgi:hypothetical protein